MSNDNKNTDKVISMEDFLEEAKREEHINTTEELLTQVKEYNLDNILLAGVNVDGSFRFFSNFRDPKTMVFLLESFKMMIVDQVMDGMTQVGSDAE